MGIIKYIPMVADITMDQTESKLRYNLTVAVYYMEMIEVKLRYILMEAKDIYTQMELDAFAERMVVRGTVRVMVADTSRMNMEIP